MLKEIEAKVGRNILLVHYWEEVHIVPLFRQGWRQFLMEILCSKNVICHTNLPKWMKWLIYGRHECNGGVAATSLKMWGKKCKEKPQGDLPLLFWSLKQLHRHDIWHRWNQTNARKTHIRLLKICFFNELPAWMCIPHAV